MLCRKQVQVVRKYLIKLYIKKKLQNSEKYSAKQCDETTHTLMRHQLSTKFVMHKQLQVIQTNCQEI